MLAAPWAVAVAFPNPRAAMTRLAVLLLTLLFSACGTAQVVPAAPPLALSPGNDGWRVHFIDIGQGLAVLLEFPCGAALVDTGGEEDGRFHSTPALQAYLDAFFERRTDLQRTLDLLVLSHPHIDHTRGTEMVLANYRVRNAIDNGMGQGSGGRQQAALQAYVQAHRTGDDAIGYRAVHLADITDPRGLTDAVIDPIRCPGVDPQIRVLWGQVAVDPGWPGIRFGKTPFQNANNHSVVLRVDFGAASGLFTGDLEEPAIRDLVARSAAVAAAADVPAPLDVDVYQVGHHGSLNGTLPELVAAMSPQVAVFSMGPSTWQETWSAWKYGHPRQEIVAMLERGIGRKRSPVEVLVGVHGEQFVHRPLQAALYGTGWDGTVVIEARADGRLRVVTTGRPGGLQPVR